MKIQLFNIIFNVEKICNLLLKISLILKFIYTNLFYYFFYILLYNNLFYILFTM